MSVAMAIRHTGQTARFWQSTNGKKIVMAVTGALMFLFVVGHLMGNLLIFAGSKTIDDYARFLHFDETLLWIIRSVLIIAIMLHIVSTVQLAIRNKQARPTGYSRWRPINSSYASRTMYWSGPIVLVFIIFHLLQFTAGTIHPHSQFISGDVYHNVVAGFSVWWVSAWYMFALALLSLHLRHGLWSMLQSVGLSHSLQRERVLKRITLLISVLIFLGFISIPASIMLGLIR